MPPHYNFEPDMDYSSRSIVSQKGSSVSSDTVILFDWDDTLLASSWVSKFGLRPSYTSIPLIPEEVRQELDKLESVVIRLLTTALKYGRVVIVTAAETGWVELSASLFLPRCLHLLESSNVRIVSARSTYEATYPNQPKQWKVAAFHQEVFISEYERPKHVLSFGDSTSEREALMYVTELMEDVYGKSMKFITRPTAQELRQQVELVLSCLEYMCTHPGDLDLQLSKDGAVQV
jgi:hypothetical protein